MNRKQRGLSIIEILVALVISSVLLIGVVDIYQGTRQSYAMSESLGRMQESARFAFGALGKEIRMAGAALCRLNSDKSVNTLNTDSPFTTFFDSAIIGYDGGNSVFPVDGFPGVGTGPGDRDEFSDAFIISRGDGSDYSISGHNIKSAQFKLNKDHDLAVGDVLIICDGENSGVFQVTNANTANVTIVHNTGSKVAPGNCSKAIRGTGSCTSGVVESAEGYDDGAQIIKMVSRGYFVGVSANGKGNSLYEVALNTASTGFTYTTRELVDNLETMQLQFGVDINSDGYPNAYMRAHEIDADAAIDWGNVVAVRVGLLMRTPEEVAENAITKTFDVAGTRVIAGAAGGPGYTSDQRLRYVFSNVVKLRNRGDI